MSNRLNIVKFSPFSTLHHVVVQRTKCANVQMAQRTKLDNIQPIICYQYRGEILTVSRAI